MRVVVHDTFAVLKIFESVNMMRISRRRLLITASLLIIAVAAGAALVAQQILSQVKKPKLAWSLNSGESVPKDQFLVLLFPVGEVVALADVGEEKVEVRRAILTAIDELESTTLTIYVGDKSYHVSRHDFSAIPNEMTTRQLVTQLNLEIKRWGSNTEWSNVKFAFQDSSNSESRATLTIQCTNRITYEYIYDVSQDGRIHPFSITVHR